MPKFKKPIDILKHELVSKRFFRPQDIGNFVKAFSDKFMSIQQSPSTFVDEKTFLDFLTYIDNYEYVEI